MDGQLSVDDIKRYRDEDGISVYDAMLEYGLDPDAIADNRRADVKAFIEVHIEQGPVLEAAKKILAL